VPLRARDIHYETALDQPSEPGAGPVLVGEAEAETEDDWLPVIPHPFRRENIAATTRYYAARWSHTTAYHGLRLPWYLLLTVIYAIAGVFRLAGRQIAWWWVTEQRGLESEAAAAGDAREYRSLHRVGKETRKVRGWILAGEVVTLVVAGALARRYVPWWAWSAVLVATLPWLAHHGRPADRRIVSAAVVAPRFRLINADVVLRAYYAAGLGHPDKPDQQITFGSTMQRDGEGSRVVVDLPFGKGLKDAVAAKDEIGSGLDVTTSQVFLHRDPSSARRHMLWVADRDPLAVPVGRTPLLACKPTDIWKAAPLGLDERGQLVKVLLMWVSVLVSALPRSGKTFAARLLALYAALDPYVQLDVFDFKGSPDWRKFALVADSCAFGLTPSRAGMPLQIFGDTLEALKADVQDRYHRLSDLPPDVCPEGKLTRQIARDPRLRMPVRLLVIDEFQEVYDLPEGASKEVASLLTYLVKVAPGAGVTIVGSTQRPSGVGSGQVGSQFTSFRDNFAVRFGLRTSSWQVSELCLGAGAYSEGLDTSALLPQYKGVGILRGASDASLTVRTYLADGQDAERILTATRTIRERAGTLSGMALGETPREQPSVLADVLAVLGQSPGMHWETLAQLLAERFPDRHGDCTAESVSAQCRAAGVPSVDVKQQGRSKMGCRREHVEAALRDRRQ
jgi:hypothetical protein